MPGTLKKALLVLASLALVFVAGEVVCRLFFPDTRLRNIYDPDLLFVYAPNQLATLASGAPPPTARINEMGLRGPSLKEVSPRRILFVGDSFTFGAAVSEEDTFVGSIDRALGREVSVVNGGHGGYGIHQIERLVGRLRPIVEPELVVLVIWEGMLFRQPPSEERVEEMRRKAAGLQRLKSLSLFGLHLYRLFEQAALRVGASELVVSVGYHDIPRSRLHDEFRRAVAADMERVFRVNEAERSRGARFMVVLWPRAGFAEPVGSGLSAGLTEKLEAFCRESEIPFLSLEEVFEPYAQDLLVIPYDGHPTPFAHCLVARRMMRAIQEIGYQQKMFLDCDSRAMN